MTRRAIFLTLGLLLTTISFAQKPDAPPPAAKPDYSKEASIIESYRTSVINENDVTVSKSISCRVRLQSNAGVQQYGLLQFGYSSWSEELTIEYVRVRKPDGIVVETPPDSIQDMPAEIMRQAPMYTDTHEKHVAVKGLGVGDVLEYQMHSRMLKPLIPGQFWYAYDFFRTGIVIDEELEISVPRDRQVNVKSAEVKPTLRDEGTRRVYTWKTANLENKTPEAKSPLDIPPPAVQLTSFRSWEELGHW